MFKNGLQQDWKSQSGWACSKLGINHWVNLSYDIQRSGSGNLQEER